MHLCYNITVEVILLNLDELKRHPQTQYIGGLSAEWFWDFTAQNHLKS